MQKIEAFTLLEEIKGKFEKVNNLQNYEEKLIKWLGRQSDEINDNKVYDKFTQTALEYVDIDAKDWEFIGGYVLLKQIYHNASINRGYDKKDKYGDFYSLIKKLSETKLSGNYTVYNQQIIENYTKEEIDELGKIIVPERDELFKFMGLYLLNDRYLATTEKGKVFELPQERFLVIAMTLMVKETENRIEKVKESYWAMSNLYMTVATPTLSNAGKDSGQLSSCFIDVMDDSIDGIYGTNHDTARVSKWGGGQGIYIGKVRSLASSIRGREGVSSGTVPWIRLLNQTAVSVDQLGKVLAPYNGDVIR